MPNDSALADTGLSFERGFCSTAMCSPSRATLLTGLYPSQHGVTLTLTGDELRPDSSQTPAVIGKVVDILRKPGTPRGRVLKQFARGAVQAGPKSGGEPVLPTGRPNLASLLGDAGYHVAYRGKWHLTHPEGSGPLLNGWTQGDAEKLDRDYGFKGWVPPDAGENAKAAHFGGGNAGSLGEGWDEDYTRQAEEFLGDLELPEPFCLVLSLVNPHDVLGYPAAYQRGGYSNWDFRDLGVGLPPTIDEDLSDKPVVHTLMQMGMTAYMGPVRSTRAKLEYVNFYAHLHRVVDEKIGRVLGALGDAGDPSSLRSRTVIVRVADHGEMGLSHGGLRQKMFNTYEETLRVPLVVSNPVLFPKAERTEAMGALVDVLPTVLTLAGVGGDRPELRGEDLSPVLADKAAPDRDALEAAEIDLAPIVEHPSPAPSVQDSVHFTFDDHQAATALQNVPGQPNRIRAIRTDRHKYAFYFDPEGKRPTEYEMYDLERDPNEAQNLVHRFSGEPLDPSDQAARVEIGEQLDELMGLRGTRPAAPSAAP